MYRFAAGGGATARAGCTLLGSGAILREVITAAEMLGRAMASPPRCAA